MIDNRIPINVDVSELVELSFKYLSDIFFRLENTDIDVEKLDSFRRLTSPSEIFLSKISRIPLLLKTCLLIHKDKLRQRVFDFYYMKRCLLNEDTVGEWIVIFLANDDTSSRVIEYFEILTKLTPSDALGVFKPQITDIMLFHSRLESVMKKIAEYEFILPALFMLKENDMKRACNT